MISRTFIGLSFAVMLFSLAGCDAANEKPRKVIAEEYDAFWLWAGVKPQPVLEKAKSVYILAGEMRAEGTKRFTSMRPATPKVRHADIWMVVRVETLRWNEEAYAELLGTLRRWEASNRLVGLQIDFDAQTMHLDEYATFLRDLRSRLPKRYRLSITGLLDWSSNANPQHLEQLGGVVDEIVVQTYQGRETVVEYNDYLPKLARLDTSYRIGLVQNGEWQAPDSLKNDPNFQGYVVFLLNPAPEK